MSELKPLREGCTQFCDGLCEAHAAKERIRQLEYALSEADCPNSDSRTKPCMKGEFHKLQIDGSFTSIGKKCEWCARRDELLSTGDT